MRLRTSQRTTQVRLVTLGLLSFLVAVAHGAAPTELWPLRPPPVTDAATLAQRVTALDAATAVLPPELRPAIRFEQTFLRILSGEPIAEWLPQIRGFAQAGGNDPVTVAVHDVAQAWLARAEMADIQSALESFYVQNVRFPATLAEVERDLPKEKRVDPWGQPWVYQLRAPLGFAKETGQRFQLGPTRYPALGTLHEATTARRPFSPPAWKIALRTVGGSPALEFQTGGAVVGLIQPGGRIDAYPLLFIGDHWALMGATDQLFTVAF